VPALNRLFHTVPFGLRELWLMLLVASTVLWVDEIYKALVRRRGPR